MSIMSKIKDFMNKFAAKAEKETTEKRFISREIGTINKGLESCLDTLVKLQKNVTAMGFLQVYLKQDKTYQLIYKNLRGTASHEEARQPLACLAHLLNMTINELSQLLKYLANNPDIEKSEEYQQITMSQAAFVGVVETCYMIERFSKAFLFRCIYVSLNHDESASSRGKVGFNGQVYANYFAKLYPWMDKDIENNLPIILDVFAKYGYSGKMDFSEKIIALFKSNNFDPQLVTEDGKANTDFIDAFESETQVSQCAMFGIGKLNLYRWWGQRKLLKEHEAIMRQEYEAKWMANNITLLEYQQSNMDPESPEYKELQKVIDYYAELIAKSSAEIDKYRNG